MLYCHKYCFFRGTEMKDYRYVIWDFNGTLLDDVSTGITALNVLLSRRGLPPVKTEREYRDVFRFPIIDYYKDVGFDFTRERFDDVANEWVKAYLDAENPVACRGVKPVLKFFRSRDVEQVIISASEKEMLLRQLDLIDLSGYFSEICGRDDIYASSKKEMATKWAHRAPPGQKLFIGDTTHDYEVARAIDADVILLCNGHQSRKRLEKCNCPVLDGAWQILDTIR